MGLWAAIAAVDDGVRRPALAWGLAGLFFGFAYLTRPEGIWYAPAVGGVLLAVAWLRRQPWRAWLAGAALFGLGFMLSFFPYAVHTRIHTGGWMVSEKVGITFQDALALAQNDLAGHDRVLWQLDSSGEQVFFFSRESFHLSMLDQILADPRLYARVLRLNVQNALAEFFTVEGFPPAMLPVLGVGLFAGAWSRRRWRGEAALWAGLLPPLTFLLFFIFTRYLSPLLLPMLVWTGLGLARLGDWSAASLTELLGGRRPGLVRWAWLAPTILVAGILLALQPRVAAAVGSGGAVRWEHRAAGEWLAAHAAADDVVMARYPAVAFYADRRWIASPSSDLAAALRYAAANSADYWVVDAQERAWRPQLAALADGAPPPGLELVYRPPTDGRPVYVYRVRQP
jgi:hypothetical protein